MSGTKLRCAHSPELKAKVGLGPELLYLQARAQASGNLAANSFIDFRVAKQFPGPHVVALSTQNSYHHISIDWNFRKISRMNTISPSAEAAASVVLLLQILAYAVMLYPVAYLVGMVAGPSLGQNITWLISIVAAFVVSRVMFDPTKSSTLVRRALGFVITPFASHLSSVSSRTVQVECAVLTLVGFGGVTGALYTMTLLASFNGLMVRYS